MKRKRGLLTEQGSHRRAVFGGKRPGQEEGFAFLSKSVDSLISISPCLCLLVGSSFMEWPRWPLLSNKAETGDVLNRAFSFPLHPIIKFKQFCPLNPPYPCPLAITTGHAQLKTQNIKSVPSLRCLSCPTPGSQSLRQFIPLTTSRGLF